MMTFLKSRQFAAGLGFLALVALSGCAGLSRFESTEPLRLTGGEARLVGERASARLVQLLGGPYFDQPLTTDINRLLQPFLAGGQKMDVAVADRSAPEFYVLPGGRIVLTRGLLAAIRTRAELDRSLTAIASYAQDPGRGLVTRRITAAATGCLAEMDADFDPQAACITLARLVEERGCDKECLAAEMRVAAPTVNASMTLPDSFVRLQGLQDGYDLLGQAAQEEEDGRLSDAITDYLQAAFLAADEPRILGALGLAYLRAGQPQQARLHLQKSVKLQPGYYKTQMGLGYLYLQQGKIRQASERLTESVRLLPVTENLFLLAEAQEKGGAPEQARPLYELVVRTDRYSKLGKMSRTRLKEMAGGNE